MGRDTTEVSIKNRLVSLNDECGVFKKMINEYTEDDCIYIRGVSNYFLDWYLLSLPRKAKVVFEINGLTLPDHRERIRPAKGIVRKLFYISQYMSCLYLEDKIFQKSNGIVSVTNEITKYNTTLTKGLVPCITIGNGISTANNPLRTVPNDKNTLHILVVAYINFWHGIDRFIMGLSNYKSNTHNINIILHVVGEGPELSYLKSLIKKWM